MDSPQQPPPVAANGFVPDDSKPLFDDQLLAAHVSDTTTTATATR